MSFRPRALLGVAAVLFLVLLCCPTVHSVPRHHGHHHKRHQKLAHDQARHLQTGHGHGHGNGHGSTAGGGAYQAPQAPQASGSGGGQNENANNIQQQAQNQNHNANNNGNGNKNQLHNINNIILEGASQQQFKQGTVTPDDDDDDHDKGKAQGNGTMGSAVAQDDPVSGSSWLLPFLLALLSLLLCCLCCSGATYLLGTRKIKPVYVVEEELDPEAPEPKSMLAPMDNPGQSAGAPLFDDEPEEGEVESVPEMAAQKPQTVHTVIPVYAQRDPLPTLDDASEYSDVTVPEIEDMSDRIARLRASLAGDLAAAGTEDDLSELMEDEQEETVERRTVVHQQQPQPMMQHAPVYVRREAPSDVEPFVPYDMTGLESHATTTTTHVSQSTTSAYRTGGAVGEMDDDALLAGLPDGVVIQSDTFAESEEFSDLKM